MCGGKFNFNIIEERRKHVLSSRHINFFCGDNMITCKCGSVVNMRGWDQHCKTIKHIKIALEDATISENKEKNEIITILKQRQAENDKK